MTSPRPCEIEIKIYDYYGGTVARVERLPFQLFHSNRDISYAVHCIVIIKTGFLDKMKCFGELSDERVCRSHKQFVQDEESHISNLQIILTNFKLLLLGRPSI